MEWTCEGWRLMEGKVYVAQVMDCVASGAMSSKVGKN